MIPSEPQRRPQLGFLYFPPYRVQGLSVAGEESVVQVPELDICFDIGLCPRPALTSPFVALTHGHMDHSAGIAYYFSQRHFQGMSPGTLLCHPALEQPIRNLMTAWIDVEAQKTPYNLVALPPEAQHPIKKGIVLRSFATNHRVPSLGFVVVEQRSKLKPQYAGLPQEQLMAIKNTGETITQNFEVPLVCYTGDTAWGPHFERPDVLNARILITECTFPDPGHRDRAQLGMHMHLDDLVQLFKASTAQAVVVTHLSRRTHLSEVRKQFNAALGPSDRERLHILMDNRTNRETYQKQLDAEPAPAHVAPDDAQE